jgi:hypothetical protein
MTITKGTSSPSPSPSGSGGGESSAAQQFLSSPGSSSVGRIYMGTTRYSAPPGANAQGRKQIQEENRRGAEDRWISSDEADAEYFTWSPKARDDFRAKGLLSGLLSQGAGDMEAADLWHKLVLQAANYGANDQKVSPLDILAGYVKGNSNGGWIKQGDFEINPVTGEKRYIGPKFKTTTQTSVDLTDPATARAIATKVFQDMLGRDPGQGEISAYANALSQSEASSPSTTTTTTQYDPVTGDPTSSSAVTAGGVTADGQAQLALDQVKKKAEYGATQAATTYQNALEQAVYGGH